MSKVKAESKVNTKKILKSNTKVNTKTEIKSEQKIITNQNDSVDIDKLKEKYEYKPLIQTKTIYVNPEDRIMSEVMTKFELTRIIGIRAAQLENHNKPFTDVGDISDPIEMAKKEIRDKKCPLSIIRVRSYENDKIIAELWEVNEMAIPTD
jgi:DNA-directed RNA polymerases I, II, and III subunit RPABC2